MSTRREVCSCIRKSFDKSAHKFKSPHFGGGASVFGDSLFANVICVLFAVGDVAKNGDVAAIDAVVEIIFIIN